MIFPSDSAGCPRHCSMEQLTTVATLCNGSVNRCSMRKGNGTMKNRNSTEGPDQRSSGHPPRSQTPPARAARPTSGSCGTALADPVAVARTVPSLWPTVGYAQRVGATWPHVDEDSPRLEEDVLNAKDVVTQIHQREIRAHFVKPGC